MNTKYTKGFTLIELMIVVAIVAILAAIALPAYQNYIKRAKITEGLVAADACKGSVSEYVAAQNKVPALAADAGCDNFQATQYVKALDVKAGVITVTLTGIGTGVDNKDVVLTPDVTKVLNGQLIGWKCTGTVDTQLLPASCR